MIELTRADSFLAALLEGDAELSDLIDAARVLELANLGRPVPAPMPAERVYYGAADADALEPFATWQESSPEGLDLGVTDVEVAPATRVLTHLSVTAKAVGPGASFDALEPIVDRLDDLLQGAAGAASPLAGGPADVYVGEVRRSAPVKYPEVADGRRYVHLGGVYRLTLHRHP